MIEAVFEHDSERALETRARASLIDTEMLEFLADCERKLLFRWPTLQEVYEAASAMFAYCREIERRKLEVTHGAS